MAKPTVKRQRAQRSDALRNIEAILDAAAQCFQHNPQASMTEIAQAAGLGRITLYGHFPSRAELISAVLLRTIENADAALDGVDLSGPPMQAISALTARSWAIVDRFRGVLQAAESELDHEQIVQAHDRVLARIGKVIRRGQQEGAFRTDLSAEWLLSCTMSLMHNAAAEVQAQRLTAEEAPKVLAASFASLFRTPDDTATTPRR